MPLSAGDKLGHYEVLSLLGQGGMGEVYRAKDTTLKREVALKVLPTAVLRDPKRLARFQREAEVLASLDHPNIGPIFGMVESAGARALVLAMIEGPTLKDRIASGALPLEEAFQVARQIAEALEYAHDRGVIHRDLKPANVKITPEGSVKVLDFGLAKVLEDEHPQASGDGSFTLTMGQTSAGMILGTAAYMSPEQAVGMPADRRCDIFSFGAVLFEMLTTKRAFAGGSATEILASVVKDDPDWSRLPAGTPPAIVNLLHRCLVKDRKQRLQAIGEARITLSNPWESPAVGRNQRMSTVPWIAAALLAIALPAVWFLRPASPQKAITLEVAGPEGNTFASPETHFVLSPDGLHAVFVAQNKEGQSHVRLRTMDSGIVTPLSGTEDANRLFWSPDSRWIGFFAAGKLQKISIDGGRPQIVCEGVQGLGSGTWNRDGVILFSEPPKQLQKVSASGGTPKPALPLDEARHEILQVEPYFLPDGKHFLYLSHTSGAERGIVWASLDGKERRFLVQNFNSPASYAPSPAGSSPGWMIRNSGGRLLAQTLDPKTGELQGEPMQIADPVPYGPNWSTSNTGIISFPRTIPVQKQMVWIRRDGSPMGVLGEIGIGAPSISPDHKTVAYTRQNARDSDIWLFDLVRNVPRRFTFESGLTDSPVWTPDGTRIVYTAGREAFPRLVERSEGTGPETILKQFEYFGGRVSTAFTKDGRWLSFAQNTGGDANAFFISRPEGKVVPFPEPQVLWAALSPDGLWVVYATSASGGSEIFVRSSPQEVGGTASAKKFQISTAGGTFPKWRSDGKEIFYVSLDGKMMAAPVESDSGVFLPGTPKALFDAGSLFAQSAGVAVDFPGFDVTSDGQRFLLTTVAARTLDTPVTVILNWTVLLKK